MLMVSEITPAMAALEERWRISDKEATQAGKERQRTQ
jgi:hypothetical protein